MLSALKKVWQGAGCAGCDPAILAKCKAAEAGSVSPHAWHVFVKVPTPANAATSTESDESWWPERIEDEVPAVASALAAVKAAGDRIHGKVKITACDYQQPTLQPPGTCDAFIFPEGLVFQALPLDRLAHTVVEALAGATTRLSDATAQSLGEAAAALGGSCVQGTAIMFVCCHTSRDARCGALGPPLVDALTQLAEQNGLAGNSTGSIRVLKTSHVGGHVYAGNVLVFSHGKRYHGDWFGGINTSNAAAFLDALLACKAPSGAPGDLSLRPWWRGRIGLTKEQQLECFAKGLADIEDMSPSSAIGAK